MLSKLDLLTPQERKTGLLMVFSSYSSSVTALLIASQVLLDFTYIAFGTSLFSRLLSKRRKKHLLKEGLPDGLPETEICDFWDWHETEKSGGILNGKCECRTRIQGAKRTQLSSGIPSQWRTAEYLTEIFN